MERDRARLVRSLERSGIRDRRVLDAMGRVPRERFVPDELAAEAYEDRALPIGLGQTISQPYVVARMTELLEVRPDDRVLEVGTGSGYQAAVLALLSREVVTAERHPELAAGAAARLRDLGYSNVTVVGADASAGLAGAAPFDRILVAAATPALHPDLLAQCGRECRVVAPVGPRDGQVLTVVHADGRVERAGAVQFVPLVGPGGSGT